MTTRTPRKASGTLSTTSPVHSRCLCSPPREQRLPMLRREGVISDLRPRRRNIFPTFFTNPFCLLRARGCLGVLRSTIRWTSSHRKWSPSKSTGSRQQCRLPHPTASALLLLFFASLAAAGIDFHDDHDCTPRYSHQVMKTRHRGRYSDAMVSKFGPQARIAEILFKFVSYSTVGTLCAQKTCGGFHGGNDWAELKPLPPHQRKTRTAACTRETYRSSTYFSAPLLSCALLEEYALLVPSFAGARALMVRTGAL